MTRRLKWIGPLKFGIVAAIFQALLSLIVIPFFLLGIAAGTFAPHQTSDSLPQTMGLGVGLIICIMLPFIYALVGFIFGCLAALVYNLVAKLTGGIEFVVD